MTRPTITKSVMLISGQRKSTMRSCSIIHGVMDNISLARIDDGFQRLAKILEACRVDCPMPFMPFVGKRHLPDSGP